MKFNIGNSGSVHIITVFEGYKDINESPKLYNFITENDLFKAKCGDIYSDISSAGSNIILLGLGSPDKVNSDSIRKAFYKLGKKLMEFKIKDIRIDVPNIEGFCYSKTVQAIAEGLIESEYSFEKYLSKKKVTPTVEDVYLNIIDEETEKAQLGIDKAILLMDSVFLARDLVNEPAIYLTPEKLAETAHNELTPLGISVDIYNKDEISKLGMDAFLAVSQGSANEPRFIVMTWNGDKGNDYKTALVGKGLTYDSGGYSIKPTDSMVDMKSDMAGSATVIATMKALATSKVKQNVVAIVAACENLISSKSYKPGDIVSSMSGKTIEVLNTDAEGRLTLADALWYAVDVEKADQVIDIATLTGACVVALGDVYTGAITNNDDLMDKLISSANSSDEYIWKLPTNEAYKDLIKGTYGDLANTGGRGAGTITAGLFLEEFVKDTPWVHLDIAGTSFLDKQRGYLPKGATGVLVKTLYNLINN